MNISEVSALAQRVNENISRVIVGKEKEVGLIITALICGGHVLLDDVPGTGTMIEAPT